MTVRIAINGFGRIGRNVVRALYESGRRAEVRGGHQRAGGCLRHGIVEILIPATGVCMGGGSPRNANALSATMSFVFCVATRICRGANWAWMSCWIVGV